MRTIRLDHPPRYIATDIKFGKYRVKPRDALADAWNAARMEVQQMALGPPQSSAEARQKVDALFAAAWRLRMVELDLCDLERTEKTGDAM